MFDLLEGKEGLPTNVVREALPGRVTVRELFERLLFERFQRAPLPAKFRLVRKVTRNIRELESVQTALEQVEPWRHAFAHRAEIVTELPQVEFAPWYGPKSVSSDECERELNRLDEAVRLLGDVVTEEFRVRIIYALGKGSETAASRCLPWGKYPVVCVRLPPERQLDQAKMKDHAVALVVDREIAEDRSRFALLLHEIDSDPVLSRLRSSACVWAWHSPSEALRSALTQEKMVVVADEQELREFLEPLLRSATTQQRPTLGPTPDVGA
ncbi:MAG: hypothetical protein HY720_29020 [Planctomycetes bacterium]|nr:hypothetical protein [Planctomycetota bacterium]